MDCDNSDFYRKAAQLYAANQNNYAAAAPSFYLQSMGARYSDHFQLQSMGVYNQQWASAAAPSESTASSPSKRQSEVAGSSTSCGFAVNQTHSEPQKAYEDKRFDDWCSTLKEVEVSSDLPTIRDRFFSFLKAYPLCFGYWKRLSAFEMKLGKNLQKADEVLIQGLKVNPQCVELWMARIELYQKEGRLVEEENACDKENQALDQSLSMTSNCYSEKSLRAIFEEGLANIGGDWASAPYWKLFLQFEIERQNWEGVGGIYYRLFCSDYIIGSMEELMEKFKEFLAGYKNNFEKLVHPNEMKEYNAMLAQVELKEEAIKQIVEQRREEERKERERRLKALAKQFETKKKRLVENAPEEALMKLEIDYEKEKDVLIKELDEKAARNTKNDQNDQTTRLTRHQKDMIVKARESGFNSSMKLIERRKQFESSIRRPYFHPKPLDSNQLSNWRSYLDFEINESSSTWPERVVRLFSRCLVACNNYPEFWVRFIDWFVDVKQDFASARHYLERARSIYLPDSVAIWIKSAEVEECYGLIDKSSSSDYYDKAKAFLVEIDRRKDWSNCEVLLYRISFERRHQNWKNCHQIFQSAISLSEKNHRESAEIDDGQSDSTSSATDRVLQSNSNTGSEVIEWRPNLSPIARVKLAIFYAYFLVHVDGDIEKARDVLKNARELRCSRQSLLLASIDIETHAKLIQQGAEMATKQLNCSDSMEEDTEISYMDRVSELYEELLQESSLLSSDLVSSIWHRYVTFLIIQGAPISTIRAVKVRAFHSLSELMK